MFNCKIGKLLKEIGHYENEIIRIRREIHSNPELFYNEFETSKLVAEKLQSIGIEVTTNVGLTGVMGLLRGTGAGKTVGLRADMDALPVEEDVDVPFKSTKKGIMHACGHDAHTAMLLGAAMLLLNHKSELHGTVKFLFQPAEEQGAVGGAKLMIEAGVMANPKVDYIFGLHLRSTFPSKTFAMKAGPIMATADSFKIRIIGRGGHASRPNEAIDPVFVSAMVVIALQAIPSRMVDQTKPFALSVCNVHSGAKNNVIPGEALIEGTIRTLHDDIRILAKKATTQIVESVCSAYGASCEVEFAQETYPITFNDERVAPKVFEILRAIEGTQTIETEPVLAAEDFSRFLQKAQGAFFFLGTYNEKKGCVGSTHSSKFKVDEEVLKYGSVSLAALALEFCAEGV